MPPHRDPRPGRQVRRHRRPDDARQVVAGDRRQALPAAGRQHQAPEPDLQRTGRADDAERAIPVDAERRLAAPPVDHAPLGGGAVAHDHGLVLLDAEPPRRQRRLHRQPRCRRGPSQRFEVEAPGRPGVPEATLPEPRRLALHEPSERAEPIGGRRSADVHAPSRGPRRPSPQSGPRGQCMGSSTQSRGTSLPAGRERRRMHRVRSWI